MPCRARKLLLGLVGSALIAGPIAAQPSPARIPAGPYVDPESFSIELPLEVLANKLFVRVEIGGEAKRFVFDTGSPSMIGKQLATELGLEPLGKIKGKDSHGAVVESEIVEAELSLGGTTLREIPILVADFSSSSVLRFLHVIRRRSRRFDGLGRDPRRQGWATDRSTDRVARRRVDE